MKHLATVRTDKTQLVADHLGLFPELQVVSLLHDLDERIRAAALSKHDTAYSPVSSEILLVDAIDIFAMARNGWFGDWKSVEIESLSHALSSKAGSRDCCPLFSFPSSFSQQFSSFFTTLLPMNFSCKESLGDISNFSYPESLGDISNFSCKESFGEIAASCGGGGCSQICSLK